MCDETVFQETTNNKIFPHKVWFIHSSQVR